MTTKTNHNTGPDSESKLLNPEERAALNQIGAQDPPFSQRARALLAIDEGATQSAAGHEAGLSLGQVRYWLGRFRKGRMSIFPQELLEQALQIEAESPQDTVEPVSPPDTLDPEPVAVEEEIQIEIPEAQETAEAVDDSPAPQEKLSEAKKKSKKKSGKSKKSKKAKKQKKDKKSRKEKKTKKKAKKKTEGKEPKKEKKDKGSKGKSGKKKRKK